MAERTGRTRVTRVERLSEERESLQYALEPPPDLQVITAVVGRTDSEHVVLELRLAEPSGIGLLDEYLTVRRLPGCDALRLRDDSSGSQLRVELVDVARSTTEHFIQEVPLLGTAGAVPDLAPLPGLHGDGPVPLAVAFDTPEAVLHQLQQLLELPPRCHEPECSLVATLVVPDDKVVVFGQL